MRLLFYLDSMTWMRGATGGVRKYAEIAKNLLRDEGHEVDLCFDKTLNQLPDYDAIHVFSSFYPNLRIVEYSINRIPVVVSPIYDPVVPGWQVKALGCLASLPGLNSNHAARKRILKLANHTFFMSGYEKEKAIKHYSYAGSSSKYLIPTEVTDNVSMDGRKKQILFVGDIGNPRQNIARLINATQLIDERLILAGPCSNSSVLDLVANADNVEYLGYISDEEKSELMRTCHSYVLPALTTGFGISAIEAAQKGMSIAFSNRGGTYEYLNRRAHSFDAYNVSSMAKALRQSLLTDSSGCLNEIKASDVVNGLIEGYKKSIQNWSS